MIKIALIGYGSMGKEIEFLSKDNNIEITKTFDEDNPLELEKDFDFDVGIEFSTPKTVYNNIQILAENKVNMVVGTTGWYDKITDVKKLTKNNGIGLVWGSNFSVGMQMFFKVVDLVAKLTDKFEEYDIMLHELHHKRKKDSPSGTAETLAEIILKEVKRKKEKDIETQHNQINEDTLHISSTRGGEIFGTHTVYIDSHADTLELTHRARNRKGFALGAIKAAKFISDKKGFYNFTEIFENL